MGTYYLAVIDTSLSTYHHHLTVVFFGSKTLPTVISDDEILIGVESPPL